jgi:hypothetical protein
MTATSRSNDADYSFSNDDALYTSFSSETQPAIKDPLKLLQQQYKLKCLHHAWACQYPGGNATCPDFRHCCAAKRLYQHVMQCRHVPSSSIVDSSSNNNSSNGKCPVPGCRKMRRVWAHYKRCSIHDCVLCSIVPRHRMNVVIENEPPNRTRPCLLLSPFSPKRTSADRGDYRHGYESRMSADETK